ncbi:MAG TPA: LCP family protein [Lactobacillaceae bacterium]|jgi:LCP family protein required for cell wall assembly
MDNQSRSQRFDKRGNAVTPGSLPPKKKSHRTRNIILIVAGLLLIGGLGFAGAIYNNVKNAADKTFSAAGIKKSRSTNATLNAGKPFSILLLGADTGELGRDYKGRTDSIIVATINPKDKKVTLVSLPRDATVSIDGFESTFPQKLNAAYPFGSAATTIQEIEDYLNIPIDFYALVNMGGLEKLVDKVGGIKVKAPFSFTYSQETAHDYGKNLYRFTEGSTDYEYAADGVNFVKKTVMDGDAALAFARMRYDDPNGDYGRQARQRLVIEALMKKAGNASTVLNTSFMDSLSSNVKTDLTFNDMLLIASKYLGARKNIVSDHLQGVGYNYGSPVTSYEVVPQSEKQRITNLIRSSLGLSHQTTGRLFGGDVTNVYVDAGFTNIAADTATALTDEPVSNSLLTK